MCAWVSCVVEVTLVRSQLLGSTALDPEPTDRQGVLEEKQSPAMVRDFCVPLFMSHSSHEREPPFAHPSCVGSCPLVPVLCCQSCTGVGATRRVLRRTDTDGGETNFEIPYHSRAEVFLKSACSEAGPLSHTLYLRTRHVTRGSRFRRVFLFSPHPRIFRAVRLRHLHQAVSPFPLSPRVASRPVPPRRFPSCLSPLFSGSFLGPLFSSCTAVIRRRPACTRRIAGSTTAACGK